MSRDNRTKPHIPGDIEAFIDCYELAEKMHACYEYASKEFGWETQEVTKVSFSELPRENKLTMLVTAMNTMREINNNSNLKKHLSNA